jgi:hypothetical protein
MDETAKQQFNQVSASLKKWNVREAAHRRNLTDFPLSCAFSLSHHPSSIFVAVVVVVIGSLYLSMFSLIRTTLTTHRANW